MIISCSFTLHKDLLVQSTYRPSVLAAELSQDIFNKCHNIKSQPPTSDQRAGIKPNNNIQHRGTRKYVQSLWDGKRPPCFYPNKPSWSSSRRTIFGHTTEAGRTRISYRHAWTICNRTPCISAAYRESSFDFIQPASFPHGDKRFFSAGIPLHTGEVCPFWPGEDSVPSRWEIRWEGNHEAKLIPWPRGGSEPFLA